MKTIESRDNAFFKTLRKWAAAQGRNGAPVLLEGHHLCQSWLARFGAPLHALVDADRLDAPQWRELLSAVPEITCIAMKRPLLASLGDAVSSQGVIFVVQPPKSALPAALTERAVLLDRIQDPGNLGTIFRSAAAAGVVRIYLSTACASAWSPKALRSGQGAHFALDIYEHADLADVVRQARVPVLATSLEAASDLYSMRLDPQSAWIFGHEGQGVDPALLALANERIKIAHADAVESLNVAMAATLCLFEQRRQAAGRSRSE